MEEFKNIHSLPEEVQRFFFPFLKKFIATNQEEILSVFVYGSGTGKNFIPKVSDVNSAVVVKAITPEFFKKGLEVMTLTRHQRICAPLILTEQHLASSLDVFPIEFLEMKDNYVVVYGKDFFQDILVEDHHARLFCEQQIKGKLIRIRQGYLESKGKRSVIETLLKESLNTLMPVFRTLLRIKQAPLPSDKGQILTKMREVFNIETSAMHLIWEDKKNDGHISGRDVQEVFGQYIQELERLANLVDTL